MSDSSEIVQNSTNFIWSLAELLRGDYKQSEYGRVILPFTVLRRLDCVLEGTKPEVLKKYSALKGKVDNLEPVLCAISGEQFYNTHPLSFTTLLNDPDRLAENLQSYILSFSEGARDILDKFAIETQIRKLDKANLLYLVISKFAEFDLHPDKISNLEMGYLYEDLIRLFSELSNETAGEHFTPREVIRLMTNLLFIEDSDILTKKGIVRTIYDPACGTGGMLSVAEDYLRLLNPDAKLEVFGQELNDETYAICRSDMMIKGQDASHIIWGNSFTEDGLSDRKFDYVLANPPFGVEWKKVEKEIKDENEKLGFKGRFGAGLPRINDGSFLFLQHMISKMKPIDQGGSRVAVVFNGSPLFTGAPESGESEIRRWIIENDLLEAVVGLPDELFYNTGINSYFWILSNRKSNERKGKVQLIDARDLFGKTLKNFGDKRKLITKDQIETITKLYSDFLPNDRVKILSLSAFGYMRVAIERPLIVSYELNELALFKLGTTSIWKKWLISLGEVHSPLSYFGPDSAYAKMWNVNFSNLDEFLNCFKNEDRVPEKIIKKLIKNCTHSDPSGVPQLDKKGGALADPELRDFELVPIPTDSYSWELDTSERVLDESHRKAIDDFFQLNVKQYVPDGWVDYSKTKLGYEIPFTRLFSSYQPIRSSELISKEILAIQSKLQSLVKE